MPDPDSPKMTFIAISRCANPMEAELYPAALREAEVPHRTEWTEAGELTILVPPEWEPEAQEVLERAAGIFFGPQTGTPKRSVEAEMAEKAPVGTPDPDADREDDDEGRDEEAGGMFASDALPTPEEMRIRPVWPAWALAALPGLGLGHLYAGSFQVFFYLFFCSLLGVLFFQFTQSVWSFLLNLFAWGVDLGFAALLIKANNRRASHLRKRARQAEQEFLGSL